MILRLPQGYRRLKTLRGTAVAQERIALAVQAILETSPLYEWAATHPDRRTFQGRAPVYSAPLPDGTRIVVRHGHRGGWLAPILGDLYLPPTGAPFELMIAHVLARAGVPTPELLAYATYPALGIFRRVDVATAELSGVDLRSALEQAISDVDRNVLLPTLAHLLASLSAVGAWHPDLNLKNILLVSAGSAAPTATVLDVDRIRFAPPSDPNVLEANLGRLARSSDKWTRSGGRGLTRGELDTIRALANTEEAKRATSAPDPATAGDP